MRSLCAVTLALAAPIGVAAAIQDAPAVTDVRHVRWIWRVEIELPAAGHVVVVDWHPELGIQRRYPRKDAGTRRLDAGQHTLRGDLTRREATGVTRSVTPSSGYYRLMPFMDRPEWPVSYSSPALESMRMSSAVSRFPYRAGSAWRAFVLAVPGPVSATDVDSVLGETAFTGNADRDLAELAAALGARSWGGQTPHLRRRYGL